jgi:hypothetical protein
VASYFDVAVLRCLFIRHWSEDGISWALQYFYQRLVEMQRATVQYDTHFRTRSSSVPAIRSTIATITAPITVITVSDNVCFCAQI